MPGTYLCILHALSKYLNLIKTQWMVLTPSSRGGNGVPGNLKLRNGPSAHQEWMAELKFKLRVS